MINLYINCHFVEKLEGIVSDCCDSNKIRLQSASGMKPWATCLGSDNVLVISVFSISVPPWQSYLMTANILFSVRHCYANLALDISLIPLSSICL